MAVRDGYAAGTLSYDAEEVRVKETAVWVPSTNAVKSMTGMRPGPNNPGAVTATGTPDGWVHVAPFAAVIQSTRASNAGVYTFTVDATYDVNILSTPAHATNPRNDLIIAYQPDTFYGDGNSTSVITQVVGTPSGSPADPSLAAYPDAITLARVRVNALATTITNANITDLRPANVVAVGGVLPTASSTTRNALTGIYDGMPVYRKDRNWVEVYDGASWRVITTAIASSTGDLSAITNPETGTLAYVTASNGQLYRYTGSAWARADWNTSWGIVGGRTYGLSSTAFAAGVGTTEALANVDTTACTLIAGRRYQIKFCPRVVRSADGLLILFIRDTNLAGTFRGALEYYGVGSRSWLPVVEGRYDCASNETKTFVLSAATITSGTLDVSHHPTIPVYSEVRDIGPSANLTATA